MLLQVPAGQGIPRRKGDFCLAAPGLCTLITNKIEIKDDGGDGAVLVQRARECLQGKEAHTEVETPVWRHRACAPSSPMLLKPRSIVVMVPFFFNALASAWRRRRLQPTQDSSLMYLLYLRGLRLPNVLRSRAYPKP